MPHLHGRVRLVWLAFVPELTVHDEKACSYSTLLSSFELMIKGSTTVLRTSPCLMALPPLGFDLSVVRESVHFVHVQSCKVSCGTQYTPPWGFLKVRLKSTSIWIFRPFTECEVFAEQTDFFYCRGFIAMGNLHSLLTLQTGTNSVFWQCKRNCWLERYQLRGNAASKFQRSIF